MGAQIVSFHCVLKNRIGNVLSSTFNQEVITEAAGQGELLKGLADGLQNLRKGERRKIQLSADQAYGFYDQALVGEHAREKLSEGRSLQVGDEIVRRSSDGSTRAFRVVSTTAQSVTLDGNHPLAGLDLIFEIEATEARDATSEEIAEASTDEGERLLH